MSTKQAEEFYQAAVEYVTFAEEHGVELSGELVRLESALARLYAAGVSLQGGVSILSSEIDRSNEFTKQRVRRRFQSLPFQYYTKIFNPHSDESDEVITADLIDDLIVVYDEVKDGLSLWDGKKKEEAIWIWRDTFYASWGRHALGALFALHTYCKQDDIA